MSTPVSDYDYDLPPELIAQEALKKRDRARLLHLDRGTDSATHHRIVDLPQLLNRGDLLVVNNTRVFPARLIGRRSPSGGRVECLLLKQIDKRHWEVLLHPGQKLSGGSKVQFGEGDKQLDLEVLERRFHGRRIVSLTSTGQYDVEEIVDSIGTTPLPPYIKRPSEALDHERYQTIFASVRGSVAAPTAGLHFTEDLVETLGNVGIEQVEITLHVGYGTFQPIRSERVEDHQVAAEYFVVPPESADRINAARRDGRRVIAVGTTTTRVLETVIRLGQGQMIAAQGETDLYIHPGFDFRVVGGLVTNFHLPRSSLMVLVSSFAGRKRILRAYSEAIAHRYRFYSYGEAMLIT